MTIKEINVSRAGDTLFGAITGGEIYDLSGLGNNNRSNRQTEAAQCTQR
jgi:hypothetical protein